MAQRLLSMEDKEKVIRALAEGKSERQAMKGTSIQSTGTAHLIKVKEAEKIARLRKEYLKMIEKKMDMKRRAELWADMAEATKPFSSHTEPDKEIPDWTNREKALRYIDQLGNLAPQEAEEGEGGNNIVVMVNVPRPENE